MSRKESGQELKDLEKLLPSILIPEVENKNSQVDKTNEGTIVRKVFFYLMNYFFN